MDVAHYLALYTKSFLWSFQTDFDPASVFLYKTNSPQRYLACYKDGKFTILFEFYMEYKGFQNVTAKSSEHFGKGEYIIIILMHWDFIVGMICTGHLGNFVRSNY